MPFFRAIFFSTVLSCDLTVCSLSRGVGRRSRSTCLSPGQRHQQRRRLRLRLLHRRSRNSRPAAQRRPASWRPTTRSSTSRPLRISSRTSGRSTRSSLRSCATSRARGWSMPVLLPIRSIPFSISPRSGISMLLVVKTMAWCNFWMQDWYRWSDYPCEDTVQRVPWADPWVQRLLAQGLCDQATGGEEACWFRGSHKFREQDKGINTRIYK